MPGTMRPWSRPPPQTRLRYATLHPYFAVPRARCLEAAIGCGEGFESLHARMKRSSCCFELREEKVLFGMRQQRSVGLCA